MIIKKCLIFIYFVFTILGLVGCNRQILSEEEKIIYETIENFTEDSSEGSFLTNASEVVVEENNNVSSQDTLTSYDFVCVRDHIPDIIIDLKYASHDNFTGLVIYNFSEAYLRYGTVQKLAKVQEELKKLNMGLKIWDAFRPVSAQFQLWNICPDSTYVANPNTGYSSHSRGNTIDITLVDANGEEVQIPTDFDDFTLKADRDYSDCDEISAKNAELLQTIMEKHGFKPYFNEWWHFSDCISYEVEETYVPPVN